MSKLHNFLDGGYSFLEGGFPYSQGVIAGSGFAFKRVRFLKPIPIDEGFSWIEDHLAKAGRPLTALAACELRSPTAFTLQAFQDFNINYVATLKKWGIFRNNLNPIARSNLAPQFNPPNKPSFYAFTYTVTDKSEDPKDWVIAGSGEWPEDQPFPQGIIARGDLTPSGITSKARYVLNTMQERAKGLEANWSRLTATQIYTVHNIAHLIEPEFAVRGLLGPGLCWHLCRPPIEELAFEMDVHSIKHNYVASI